MRLGATTMSEVTRVLSAIEQGDPSAADQLPLVYDELRKLAAQKMAQERPSQTLQTTALVPLVSKPCMRLLPWAGTTKHHSPAGA